MRAIYLSIIIFLFSFCARKKPERYSQDEKVLFSKYPDIFKKYKDTLLVLNSFRYIKIDTTVLKHIVIITGTRDMSYSTRDYDSILFKDYGISTIYAKNSGLYSRIYAVRFPEKVVHDKDLLSAYLYIKIYDCIHFICDTLKLKQKTPQEATRKAMQLTFERRNKLWKRDVSKMNHIDVTLFGNPSFYQEDFEYLRNNSVTYHDDASWYLSGFRDIIINSIKDTSGIFPLKMNFDTSGHIQNVILHKKIKKQEMDYLIENIKKRPAELKFRLVNKKPLSYSFIMLTASLNSKDNENKSYHD